MANSEFEGPGATTELARKGMWVGAALGAIVVALASWGMGLDRAAGALGLYVMAGLAAGGIIGFLLGAMKGGRQEEKLYNGPERRHDNSQYPGVDRRART
jgi:hypothetical protein